MRRTFLHIGAPKTGSTFLQTCFRASYDSLIEAGVLYPQAGRIGSQHFGFVLASQDSSNRDFLRQHGIRNPRGLREYIDELRNGLAAEIAETDPKTIVISEENTLENVNSNEDRKRLVELLREVCDELQILIYVKPAAARFLSGYNNLVLAGSSDPVTPEMLDLQYAGHLGRWEQLDGIDSIILRPLEKGQLFGKDLLADFCHTIGIEPERIDTANAWRNESMGGESLEFLRLINRHIKPSDFPRLHAKLVRALRQSGPQEKMQLSAEEAAAIVARQKDDEEALARRYLGRSDGRLFYQETEFPDHVDRSMSTERFIEIFAQIWPALHQQASGPEGGST